MNVFKAIKKRRSIRKFDQSKRITDEQVEKLLEAAQWAPSAGNLQSYFLYVVRNRKLKDQLAKAANDQEHVSQASVVFVVCADLKEASYYGERGINLYAIQDATIATQNICLMVTELGLGAVWVGILDEKRASQILNIPNHIRPISLLPVGYPAETPTPPQRKSIKQISKRI